MEKRIYEREKLYYEVWAEPMTTVAKRYGVSDVALRKHCKKLDMPLPKVGHWARIKAGQTIKTPPLPKSKGVDRIEVNIPSTTSLYGKEYHTSGMLSFLPEERRQFVEQYCSTLRVSERLHKPHEIIRNTKQYDYSKKDTSLPPVNRVISNNISKGHRERVYRFYNTLFKALEHLGYTLVIEAPKSKYYHNYHYQVSHNQLFACLGEDKVSIHVKELKQQVKYEPTKEELQNKYAYIKPYDYVNTGKLNFVLDSYFAMRKNWRDGKRKIIEDMIGSIVIGIMNAVNINKVIREKNEALRLKRKQEELIRQQLEEVNKKELKKLELLERCAMDWDKAQKIRKFIDYVEYKLPQIKDESDYNKLLEWIIWARGKADFLDPLVEENDIVLGKGSSIFELILSE